MEAILNKPTSLPFGLQFIERPTANNFIVPVYDEDEDISVVIDENGRRIPSVEYFGNAGTKTFTKVQDEGTDDDQESLKAVGTKTFTEVHEESSDSDEDYFSFTLSTKTETFVLSEQTDEDPGVDSTPKQPIITGTATSVFREETDSD